MRERVKAIGQRLIHDAFPLLHEKKIFFFVVPFRFFALSVWIPPFIRYIILSTRTRSFSDFILEGIIAHELCHQERYLGMGTKGYFRFAARYIFSRKAQADEERATDRLTIEKGFGRQLYELTLISHSDDNHRKIIANYLSPDEIREYSIKIGKWQE